MGRVTSPRENTGPHPIPAYVPPESEPPVSARGLTWKALAGLAAALIGLLGSTLTITYAIGESAAEQRARDREQSAQLTRIEADIRSIVARSQRHDAQIARHDTRLEVYGARIAANERAIEETKRRQASREN